MQPTPGIKTTEFWLTLLAQLIGAIAASGLIIAGSKIATILGLATVVLAQLGYIYHRTALKKACLVSPVPAPAPAPIKQPEGGFVVMHVLSLLALISVVVAMLLTGCFKNAPATPGQAAVDCTTGNLAPLAVIAELLIPGLTGGTISWTDVEAAAIKAGGDIGGCMLADLVPAIGSGSGTTKASNSALVALAHFRAATHSIATFHTTTGTY